MAAEIKIVEEAKKPLAMNPKMFGLWLFMASVLMLFAGWTSAYLVRRGEGDWFFFELPQLFWITSGLIVASSIAMIYATWSARKDNLKGIKTGVIMTFILGVAFLIGQWYAWVDLVAINAHFTGGNVSSSFIYVLTGFHGLHIVSGLVFLIIVMVSTFKFKVHSKNLNQLQMCAVYWHFLGALWLSLFVFLLLNR
jgi:cytochrome c oxidase subunit 3